MEERDKHCLLHIEGVLHHHHPAPIEFSQLVASWFGHDAAHLLG